MTEQTSAFGGTAVAEPPAPVVPLEGEDASADAGNRRKLMLVGAGLGVLVLAIAAFFLLKGGGSSSNESFVVPHHAVPTPAASSPAAKKPLTLPKKFTGTVGRDPFKPLYVAPAAGAKGGTTGGTSPSTAPSAAPTSSATGSTATTTNTAPTYHPIWIKLHKIWPKAVVFTVGYSNGKSLKSVRYRALRPEAGSETVFAKQRFALLGVSDGKVLVKYGDGTPLVLDRQHSFMVVN